MQTITYLGLVFLVAATNAYKITSDIESGMRRSGPPCPPSASFYQCLLELGKRSNKGHCTQDAGEPCTPSQTPVRPGASRKCCRDRLICYNCGLCGFYDPCPLMKISHQPARKIDFNYDDPDSMMRHY